MPRRAKTRWVVIVEAEDGQQAVYGPWYDDQRADEVARGLRKRSARYAEGDNLASYDVSVCALETWRGYDDAIGDLDTEEERDALYSA